MAQSDAPLWVLAGFFIGMISAGIVNPDYSIFGALLGAVFGYVVGRNI
jgi:hypothetical protein